MMKRWLSAVLCLLMLLTLVGCGQDRIPKAKTVTKHGVECYQVGGICYPAVFGEPQLTDEELDQLLTETDADEVADAITTVPDCLRYLKRLKLCDGWEPVGEDVRTVIETHQGTHRSIRETMLYLLAGDLEEAGRIDLYYDGNGYWFCCLKAAGTYYAFDSFQINHKKILWLDDPDDAGTGGSTSTEELINRLVQYCVKYCDYSPSTSGEYAASTYTIPDKDTREHCKAFKQREYTDEEIRQLAAAGLTLEEAADKLHTAGDAALFLHACGYQIKVGEAYIDQGRCVNFTHNAGCYIGDLGWSWCLTADYTYEHMAGGCGPISNLMNRLLAGDYDEQGYVQYLGAHAFNYFKQDGYYFFCDFANCQIICNNGMDYLYCACKDPRDIKDYYCTNIFPHWDDPEDDDYLVMMYLYPRDGKDLLPMGDNGEYGYLTDGRTCNVISSEVEDTMIMLYKRDGYHQVFADIDPDALPEGCLEWIGGELRTVNWRTGEVLD